MSKYEIQNLVTSIAEVPEAWIYKTYYEKYYKDDNDNKNIIHQPFDGRIIKVRSPFRRDTIASLCFFYKWGAYYWKDFSSGIGGDSIDFVSRLRGEGRNKTEMDIIIKYEDFLNNGGDFSIIDLALVNQEKPKFLAEVTGFDINSLSWWDQCKISLSTLNLYRVKPLSSYTIIKGKKLQEFIGFNFGFFSHTGPYQIYQPLNINSKYIYINSDYLIGSEQLQYKSDTCIIKSGLKDIMAIRDFNLDAEYVAGTSETSLLPVKTIDFLKSKYKNILTLLDNDAAGIRAMKRYEKVYGIQGVRIDLEKDTAENTKVHSIDFLKEVYSFHINKKLNKYS